MLPYTVFVWMMFLPHAPRTSHEASAPPAVVGLGPLRQLGAHGLGDAFQRKVVRVKQVTIQWRLHGEQLSDLTVLEAEANPDDCTDSIETKLGVFLVQLASRGGYLIKISDVELHE
jgi:hypothetical protein